MSELPIFIDPRLLAELHAEIAARELARNTPGKETVTPVDPLPPLVKKFWEHQEPIIPPWRLESAMERKERDEAQSRGCWTG
jgi:hypothetical protein